MHSHIWSLWMSGWNLYPNHVPYLAETINELPVLVLASLVMRGDWSAYLYYIPMRRIAFISAIQVYVPVWGCDNPVLDRIQILSETATHRRRRSRPEQCKEGTAAHTPYLSSVPKYLHP